MKQKAITIILAAAAAILGCIAVIYYFSSDRTAPKISFSGEISYAEGQDWSVLLQGVTAMDDTDGDLTGKIQVESVIPLAGESRAKVFYMVMDSSGNIAKSGRTVAYTGGMTPTGEDETQPENTEPEGGESEPDGENETKPEESRQPSETAEPTADTLPTEAGTPAAAVPGDPGGPVLKLKGHELTIPAGGKFSYQNLIVSITDDKDTEEYLYSQIILDGKYDTNQAGTYSVRIYVVDSDHNRSNTETIQLHVQ